LRSVSPGPVAKCVPVPKPREDVRFIDYDWELERECNCIMEWDWLEGNGINQLEWIGTNWMVWIEEFDDNDYDGDNTDDDDNGDDGDNWILMMTLAIGSHPRPTFVVLPLLRS